MWSSPPKFQQSPSPPKYSTWLPSPSWFPYVLSRFILKYMWPTQFQNIHMFSLNIHWMTFWTRREQALKTISRLQDDSTKGLDRQQWGHQREGWWVAPCTREATETETCWSFSQSPLLPKLVWVPDMKINQPYILNRQICSAVLAGSLIPLFQTEEGWGWQKTSVHQSPSLFQPKGRALVTSSLLWITSPSSVSLLILWSCLSG